MKIKKSLDYADARRFIDFLIVEAAKVSDKAVVAVADPAGELIAFARMDDAPLPSIQIVLNKAYTAARLKAPTRELHEKSRDAEKGFDIAYYGDSRFVGWGGGYPILVDGECVGSIAVSGLPQVEDMRLVTMAAELYAEGKL